MTTTFDRTPLDNLGLKYLGHEPTTPPGQGGILVGDLHNGLVDATHTIPRMNEVAWIVNEGYWLDERVATKLPAILSYEEYTDMGDGTTFPLVKVLPYSFRRGPYVGWYLSEITDANMRNNLPYAAILTEAKIPTIPVEAELLVASVGPITPEAARAELAILRANLSVPVSVVQAARDGFALKIGRDLLG